MDYIYAVKREPDRTISSFCLAAAKSGALSYPDEPIDSLEYLES